MTTVPPRSSPPVQDGRIQHVAHLAACCAVLNNAPVSDAWAEVRRKLPDAEAQALRQALQSRFGWLLRSGDIFFWVVADGRTLELDTPQALSELADPACWYPGQRYLAAAQTAETRYFACIRDNLRRYVLGEDA